MELLEPNKKASLHKETPGAVASAGGFEVLGEDA
jgi:hypothetical protein